MVTISNSIDNQVGASNSGVTNTLTVTNPSNTASSQAQILNTVGGATAGDTWNQFSVGTVTSWSLGIDNSDTDALKITKDDSGTVNPSTALSYLECHKTPTTGVVGNPFVLMPGYANAMGGGYAGTQVTCVVRNSDNTSTASGACLSVRVGGTSGGSPIIGGAIEGSNAFGFAMDNADGDQLKMMIGGGASETINNGEIFQNVTTGHAVTFPGTPAFMATASGVINNVTGNNTSYTVVYNSEIFDQASNYNPVTGIFVAPITGRYHFSGSVGMQQVTNGTTFNTILSTSNRAYYFSLISPTVVKDANAQVLSDGSILADMDAADTAGITVQINGIGADTADVIGTISFFSGNLEC